MLTEEQVFRVIDAMEAGDLDEAERLLKEFGAWDNSDPWGLRDAYGHGYRSWHPTEGEEE